MRPLVHQDLLLIRVDGLMELGINNEMEIAFTLCRYELILHAINSFAADLVLIIDQERLFSDLTREYGSNNKMKVMKLPKSGGVCIITHCVNLIGGNSRSCFQKKIKEE